MWYNWSAKQIRKGQIFMSTLISAVIMTVTAVIGFFVGTAIGDAIDGAILFALIAGFACIIHAIERNQKR